MSGHSKWSKIKRKKGANDASRGKIFSRLVKEITVAARMGGGYADSNARLATAIDSAKRENMPGANIERAIKRGTGEIAGLAYEEITYEGFGPGGVAILVDATTDNRNRTVAEVRKIFEKAGGNLGEQNSVGWMFKQVGAFLIDADSVDEEGLLMIALGAGAVDVSTQDGGYEVLTAPDTFHAVQTALKAGGVESLSAELVMVPQTPMDLRGRDAERCLRLMEKLDDNDDVQNVWANADIDPEVIEQLAEAG